MLALFRVVPRESTTSVSGDDACVVDGYEPGYREFNYQDGDRCTAV